MRCGFILLLALRSLATRDDEDSEEEEVYVESKSSDSLEVSVVLSCLTA